LTQTYSAIHGVLAPQNVGVGSDVRTYIEALHVNATDKPNLSGNSAFQALALTEAGLTAASPQVDKDAAYQTALAKYQPIHDDLWAADHGQLVNYIDVIRVGSEAEGGKTGAAYLGVAEQFSVRGAIAADVAAGTYDGLLAGFDGAARNTQIISDLTYRFTVIHDANKDRDAKPSYVESLFLENAPRDAAIDLELTKIGSLNSALPAAVAAKLYPLLQVGAITGGATAAAENANIIAPVVILNAAGDATAGEGRIGTLTEPKDIDFTAPVEIVPGLSSFEQQARLDAQNLRRALQTQDIVDIVHQIYVRTGGDIILANAPADGALAADGANWTKLNLVFSDLLDANPTTVTVNPGEVLGLWNIWPDQAGADGTARTYKLFQYNGTAPTAFDPKAVDWANAGADWVGLSDIKKVPETGTITISDGDIFKDLWDVQRVSAQPFADINLRASSATAATLLDMTSTGMAGIGHDGVELNVRKAHSGGFLRILTTGNLVDVSGAGGPAATALEYISLISDGEIGTASTAFTINAAGNGVLLVQATGNANIQQLGGTLSVERALVGGDLTLTMAGDLKVGDIDALGTVKLDVGGSVTDLAGDDADPSADITASALILDVDGSFGAAGARIEVDIATTTQGTVGGTLYLHEFKLFTLSDAGLTVAGFADILSEQSMQGAAAGTLTAAGLTLRSKLGNIGDVTQPFDILLTGTNTVVNARAVNDIWLTSKGDVRLGLVQSAQVVAIDSEANILDGVGSELANIITGNARLKGVGIGTQTTTGDIELTVDRLALDAGTLGAFVENTKALRIDENYFGGFAVRSLGDVNIQVRETVATNENLTIAGAIKVGDATTGAKNLTLRVGDDFEQTLASSITVTGDIEMRLDEGSADSAGTDSKVFGAIDATNIAIRGFGDADKILIQPGIFNGDVVVKAGGGKDTITVTELGERDPADSFLLDGEADSDEYIINRRSGAVSNVITVKDSGNANDGANVLTINGRDGAAADVAAADEVLVRKNFIALLNKNLDGTRSDKFERINYDGSLNGRVRVNTLGGEDTIASDDTSTIITLDGGDHDDTFQIGQMFGSDRMAPNVLLGDEIETNETTQGFLSVGNSHPMVVFGGLGEDTFNVYSNKGLTKLYGEDGNDTFVVRAFVLKDNPLKTAGGGDAEAFGGGGDDSFLYNINAPLAIDGGAGTDTIVVLGTERDDSFLITEQGIFGAGLNVSFEGVEKAEIDGLEGDDTFYVQSTAANMAVTVIGGLGSDFISIAGDVTTEIVSLEVEGSSAIVNHAVTSADPAFNEVFVDGLRLNVANEGSGLFEIDTSGLAVLQEGGTHGFYRVRMTEALTGTAIVYLTASAARSSTQDRNLPGTEKANSVLVSGSAGSGYESASVFTFTSANSAPTDWQTIYVQAPEDDAAEGTRKVVVSHQARANDAGVTAEFIEKVNTTKIANVEATVFDDDAYGIRVDGNPSSVSVVENGATATLHLTLSRQPDAGEDIFYDLDHPAGDYTVASSDAVFTSIVDGKLRLRFTHANYATGINVTVTAVDDLIEENRERQTLSLQFVSAATTQASWADVADPTEVDVRIFDNDKGEVIVTETNGDTIVSASTPDSYTLKLSKEPTADVVVSILSDGQTVANVTTDPLGRWNNTDKTVTFTAANWDTPITIDLTIGTVATEPQPTIKPGAQNHLISGIQGPLFVFGGVGPGADRAIIKGITLPSETDTDLVQVSNPVDENAQTDRLVIFNDGSAAAQSGTLSEGNLSGFDMGSTDLVLNFGTTAVPDLKTFKAGINYAEMEVVELLLGSNADTLDIESTALNTLTVVHGGGGGDTIRLTPKAGDAVANAGGSSRVLAIFGDTTQDGKRYNSRTDALDGSGRQFAAGGDDVIDASKASGFVIAYGGVGNDLITGSAFNDHLLGGSGDDTIHALGGADHVYGDNGLRIDQSVRLNQQPQLISIITQQAQPDAGFNPLTGDPLTTAGADVITGSGSNIILSDFGIIEQIAGTNRAFDTASLVNIRSVRETEGGDDRVTTTGAGTDIVLGGAGKDNIAVTGSTAIVFGDTGLLTFAADGVQALVATTSPTNGAAGDDDTISGGTGNEWVIGSVGADDISLGQGGGIVLGDNGRIESDAAGLLVRVETIESMIGGSDSITAGDGATVVFGGAAGDQITTAGGDDVIAGDMAVLTFNTGVRSVFESVIEDPAFGGPDTVATGAGDDWVLLGEGDDTSTSASGLNIVIGDAGRVEAEGTTGIYNRVESTQPGTGGNDSITGGSDRDIQIGGAGSDSLIGNLGNDLMQGDNGLLTRLSPFATGERTFESTHIREGGDDTLIGDTEADPNLGNDVMIGGIGNDKFSLGAGTDIAAGEFLRLRFVPSGNGKDLVTSFLTPAVRDLDILVQITLGVNFSSGRSEITVLTDDREMVLGGGADLSLFSTDRLDLLFLDADLFSDAMMKELLSLFASGGGTGLTGFRMISEEQLLGGAGQSPLTENGTPPADQGQGNAPALDESSLQGGDGDLRQLESEVAAFIAQSSRAPSWQMGGWRIGT
ncbi:MAG: calcium-binding protein, partial [Roseicyclus sp.]|nr:calcium-binding protein [Roseicyclus sp.]